MSGNDAIDPPCATLAERSKNGGKGVSRDMVHAAERHARLVLGNAFEHNGGRGTSERIVGLSQ
jgi:hypothetical protein